MFGLPAIQECVPDGGVFSLVIPPVAGLLLAFEVMWLIAVVTRELKRRADVIRVRDLLIEGSIGQAILFSDQRAKDDVLAVCRAGIVTMQSSGDRTAASDRIAQEAGFRFSGGVGARLRVVLLTLIAILPVGMGFAGYAYAERVASEAAAGVPEAERAAVLREVRSEPAFACPFSLGFTGAALLVLPAIAIAALEASRRSSSTRKRAIGQAEAFVDMAAIVLNPATRAYKEERDRR